MINNLIMVAGLLLASAAFAERTTSLCGTDWKFRRDPSRRAQWSAPELDETGWESVRVHGADHQVGKAGDEDDFGRGGGACSCPNSEIFGRISAVPKLVDTADKIGALALQEKLK